MIKAPPSEEDGTGIGRRNAKRPHPQKRAGPLCSGGGPPGMSDVRGGAGAAAWGRPNLDVGGQGEGHPKPRDQLRNVFRLDAKDRFIVRVVNYEISRRVPLEEKVPRSLDL